MAKHPKADALEYIRAQLRGLSEMAHGNELGDLVYMIEVAVMEADYQLTGQFPTARKTNKCG